MSRSILEVSGIGPAAAAILAEKGISSAEELAAKTPLQLAMIKGFSEVRATRVIAQAQALLAAEPPVPGVNASKEKPVGKKNTTPEKAQVKKSKAKQDKGKKKQVKSAAKKAKKAKKTKKTKKSLKKKKK